MTDTDDLTIGTAPSADYVDPRDLPRPSPGHGGFDPPSTDPAGWPAVVPVRVAEPVPTIPGAGRILQARTAALSGQSGPFLLGLDPSRPQAQLHTAYIVVRVLTAGETITIAQDESALPTSRYTLDDAAGPLRLDHLAGVRVWVPGANPVDVSLLVVGA